MKQALGYIRVSTDEQVENGVSLDMQRAELRKYCNREKLDLVGIEQDEGLSGKSIEGRPGVQRILQAVDSKEVDAVVVYKSDRISRDGIESLQIEKLFLKRGVAYLSVTEGNLTNDSVDDEFMRFIRAGLNQRERKLISLRTRQALQLKKERGERIGRPPYGWAVETTLLENDEVIKQWVKSPDEQQVILMMKSLKAKGFTTRGIVEELKQSGVKTRKGSFFSQTQVVRILKAA
ncbi:recombinase family protein [Thermodesulfobacteriota bacterium]